MDDPTADPAAAVSPGDGAMTYSTLIDELAATYRVAPTTFRILLARLVPQLTAFYGEKVVTPTPDTFSARGADLVRRAVHPEHALTSNLTNWSDDYLRQTRIYPGEEEGVWRIALSTVTNGHREPIEYHDAPTLVAAREKARALLDPVGATHSTKP